MSILLLLNPNISHYKRRLYKLNTEQSVNILDYRCMQKMALKELHIQILLPGMERMQMQTLKRALIFSWPDSVVLSISVYQS